MNSERSQEPQAQATATEADPVRVTTPEAGRQPVKPSWRERVLSVALPSTPTRDFWIALIAVALILRVIVTMGILGSMPLFSDGDAYADQGADLVNGINQDRPYYFPAGTSYLLAGFYWIFGVHLWVTHLAMIIVSVGSVVTTALLALRLLRAVQPALLAGWVLALYPGMWMAASQPFSFDVTLLCVNLTVLFALRGWDSGRLRDYAVAGLAYGFGAVTRPSTLSIGLALGVAALIVMRQRRQAGVPTGFPRLAAGTALVAVLALAVMYPALARNESQDQGLTLSVNNEMNTWFGNNPYTPNYRTNYIGQRPLSDFSPEARRYIVRFVYDHVDVTKEQREKVRDETVRYVLDHPANTLLRTVNRVRAFWGFDYTISNLFRTDWNKGWSAEIVGLVFEAGGWVILALLTFVGLIFARDLLRPGSLWLLVGLITTFAIPYILVYSGGRWHYPILGFLAIFAGMGASWLIETPNRWRTLLHSRAFWICTAIFVAIQIEYGYYLVLVG
jgi:4-amino-4-deoxy-L-arabinose transferase-like glycosyltransferase